VTDVFKYDFPLPSLFIIVMLASLAWLL